uniref:PB1 domain-containing protein n=1 Tax=Paramormyrops kingsleyae TaxID=1676925 RepID=A0A3B3SV43_9TELE
MTLLCMLLRVILNKDDIRKIQIDNLPETLEEFFSLLKCKLRVEDDLIVQYEDRDFDNELCNLTNLSDLPEGRVTLKVTVKNATESYHTDSTLDTASLPWPEVFEIPRFPYDVELQLKGGNQKDGTLLNIRKDTKSEILDKLAETIYSYTAYPSREEYDIVAQSLIKKHPCLCLKFKMGNYRNKLRMAGCSELQVNSRSSGPKQKLKKAKKAEVNFLPDFPKGRTEDVLEEERLQIIGEMKKKRSDMKEIEEMMVSTFSLRRKHIVEEEPSVAEVKIKWPALFTEQQVSVFNQGYRLVICSFNFGFGVNSNVYTKLSWINNIVSLLTLSCHLSYPSEMKRAVTLRRLPYFLSEDPSRFLGTAEVSLIL